MPQENRKQVSVIVIAELAPKQKISDCINLILNQTYKNVEILISYFKRNDIDDLKKSFFQVPNIFWIESEQGFDIIQRPLKEASGNYIFYKSINPIIWYPRHIEHHLDLFNWNKKAQWSFSFVELKNVLEFQQPYNTINWRLDKAPKQEQLLLDEIVHTKEIVPEWEKCLASFDEGKTATFMPGLILEQFKHYSVVIPEEITVSQWIDPRPPKQVLGQPISINNPNEEVIELEDGQLGIKIEYPTLVGNAEFNEHNRIVYDRIKSLDPLDIKKIAIKRTMGMGDVLLTEPVIKMLKKKYPNSAITLYTSSYRGCNDIVKYFKHKPDNVILNNENQLTQDILYKEKEFDLRFDLDLSYESRKNINYIDAYLYTAGFRDEVKNIDSKLSIINQVNDNDKIPELEYNEERLIKEKYIVAEFAGSGWKEWDQTKWKVILDKVIEQGYKIAFLSNQATLNSIHYIEKCVINQENNFNIMLNWIKYCEFGLFADNGPMQCTAALGKKCFVVAGPAIPRFTSKSDLITEITRPDLQCLHCKGRQFYNESQNGGYSFVAKCELPKEQERICLKDLSSEYVLDKFNKFLVEN